MSAIEPVLATPAAQAIAWALLQFVWQGALIGGITGVALAVLRRSAADVRYVVAAIGLSLMLTVPVVTALQSWRATTNIEVDLAGVAAVHSDATTKFADASPPIQPPPAERTVATPAAGWSTSHAAGGWMGLLLLTWFSGVALLTLRLVSGWLWVQRIKVRGTAPAAVALEALVVRLRRRLHIGRAVRILESTVVDVPTVIGWLRPVILMPACAVGALGPQQLEAIIAHELAHIRRHDYLVNLLQTLVETLLFYHPAVWWLSHRIRIERENCCDDLAVDLCGDPVTYARALADLEELRGNAPLALAVTGGSLLQRVRRLVGAPTHAGRGPGWLAGTAAVLLIAGLAAGAVNGEMQTRSRKITAARSIELSRESAVAGAPAAAASQSPLGIEAADALQTSAREMEARARELARRATDSQAEITERARTLEDQAAAALAIAGSTLDFTAFFEAQGRAAAMASHAEALAETAAAMPDVLPPIGAATARQSGNFTWSDGTRKLQVNYEGAIEFTDDDTDVRSLSPGGWLKISDGGWISSRTVEFRADADGRIERRYWVRGSERPFEPEGREWLAEALPRFIRQTGLGARGRVARFLGAGGVDAVLAEIARIEGSWARRLYYTELLQHDTLDERAIERILARVGGDLESDFELASLLIDAGDRLLVNEAARKAYFDAARTIASDFEMRRVFSAALKKGPVSSDVLAGVLDASLSIESDFEAASLLLQIAKLQPLDDRTSGGFFKALAGVGSDFEQRRVLNALVSTQNLSPGTLVAALDSAKTIESDFEQASLLLTILKHHSIEGTARTPFFRAVDSVGSPFERGRVLQAVARRTDASSETIMDVLRAAQGMHGSFESSQVLLAVAANHRLDAAARDLYIDAAERLGEFEQGRALSALVKNR